MNKIWLPKIILPDLLADDARFDASKIALEHQLKLLSEAAKEALFLPRLDVLPEELIDLLAEQYHVDFYEPLEMNIEVKRAFVKDALLWHRIKGTPAAVEKVVRRAFGISNVTEWFEYGGAPYFFRVNADVTGDDEDVDSVIMNRLRKAVFESKNARSWLEYFNLRFDSEDSIAPTDDQLIVVQPFLHDRYDYGRNVFRADGTVKYNGATVYGGWQGAMFEQVGQWNATLSIGEAVTVDDPIFVDVSLAGFRDTFSTPTDEYSIAVAFEHADDVSIGGEEQTVAATLDHSEEIAPTDEHLITALLNPLDTIKPYDDNELQTTQIFRYDGRHNYGGAISYNASVEGEYIFVTDDQDQANWVELQRELERDFDEPCTCGAREYEWWYWSIRLGEERFLQSDPQIITVGIACKKCKHVIAEYIIPSEEWEVLL